jgi:O-antigen ligase
LLFFVIMMTSIRTERDLKIVVTGFCIAFFLWMAHSYRGFLLGNVHWSVGTIRIVPVGHTFSNANDYGTILVCACPLIFPLVTLCKKYWHYLFVLGYLLLVMRLVMLSGSRGALIALVMLAILAILFSRYRFRILPVVLLALPLGWFVMPEEYQDRFGTIWNTTDRQGAELSRQGRIEGFYRGLGTWQQYPLFGAGPHTARSVWIGELVAHNLPGQLAGDVGTFGIIAFLFLLTSFGINHYNIWENYKYLQEKKLGKEGLYCWRVSIAVMYGIAALLLQGIGLDNAYLPFWIWIAAFHILAATFMQEKVTAARQGKLLPSLPAKR